MCAMKNFENIPRARKTDPETSKAAAKTVNESQCLSMLRAFLWYPKAGLTDEEAAEQANLDELHGACWWHRASDLRALGYIEWLRDDKGNIVKRMGESGRYRGVSVITKTGTKYAERMRL